MEQHEVYRLWEDLYKGALYNFSFYLPILHGFQQNIFTLDEKKNPTKTT